MDILIAASTDWLVSFRPAVSLLLSGDNPYAAVFFNPPWTLFPLIPFYLFPWGRELLFAIAILVFAFAAFRLGASPYGVVLFLLSPFLLDALLWGNVEWLAVLGFAIPGPIGLLLALVKPQMSAGVILYRLIEEWQRGRWAALFRLCAIPAAAVILSVLVFGPWPLKMLSYRAALDFNLFPWSVPVGAYLFVQSIKTHRIQYAVAASPMFFPSVTPQIWLVVFLALVSSTPRTAVASGWAWAMTALSHAM